MPGVRQQHVPNQYRNNRAPASGNRHQMNHAPYGAHMNTSQASQVSHLHCLLYVCHEVRSYIPEISEFVLHSNKLAETLLITILIVTSGGLPTIISRSSNPRWYVHESTYGISTSLST